MMQREEIEKNNLLFWQFYSILWVVFRLIVGKMDDFVARRTGDKPPLRMVKRKGWEYDDGAD